MGHVDDAPELDFLDGVADPGADEELPCRAAPRRWPIALAVAALTLAAVAVRGAAQRPSGVDRAVASPRTPVPSGTARVESFTMIGPGGVYTQVPYLAAARGGSGADAGRLLECVPDATCLVQRTLPAGTLAALRRVFPQLQIDSAWTVVVVRQGPARPQLLSREVYGVSGSHSVDVEIRPAVSSDTAVRIHRAMIEGTRSVYATVARGYLVQVSAFERYESTPGVLGRLGALVRTGQLLDVR